MAYRDMPRETRRLAREAYTKFQENPSHPSLNFKKIHNREPIYSVRVTRGYRAVGLLENDGTPGSG